MYTSTLFNETMAMSDQYAGWAGTYPLSNARLEKAGKIISVPQSLRILTKRLPYAVKRTYKPNQSGLPQEPC